mgnify:CR=1 FL=1
MKLFNSFTNTVEEFKTIEENKVKMYVCGPTVYDYAHLGHARCYITWDVLYRYLKFKGYDVTYCRNVTDVDDKILKKAEKENKTPEEVSQYWYKQFENSMKALNTLKPDIEPFATKTLGEMISMVKDLIKNGYAYESNGDVYFRVKNFKNYGYLSKQPIDQLESGARIEVGDQKEDPLDFALWKKDEKFGYNSPWGVGRPGWHIECSAMSRKYLGKTIDIHAGGADLIFPHHENELAQSCCAFPGTHFAHYWVHTGMLMINGVKMSKSLGNFYTVDEILAQYPAEALRLLFLTTHYHQPFNFTFEGLQQAKAILDKFYNALLKSADVPAQKAVVSDKVVAALADDLNTPLALSYLHETVNELNKAQTAEEKGKLKAQLLADAEMLGLLYNDPEAWFKGDNNDKAAVIEKMIAQRAEAKKNKDWATADAIREELKVQGIILEDSPTGTTWKKI